MDDHVSSVAPDAGSVLRSVLSPIRKSKWLIGLATIAAAAAAVVLYKPHAAQVWSGRAVLTIGLAPSAEFITHQGGSSLIPVETPKTLVARISDRGFRNDLVNSAAFDPSTADLSRSVVLSSLRGVVTDGDREVQVELSAGSSADVHAAFASLGAQVLKAHQELLDRRSQPLQARIEDAKQRLAELEDSTNSLNSRIIAAWANEKVRSADKTGANGANLGGNTSLPPSTLPPPILLASIPAWSQLKDRIQADTTLAGLSESTVMRVEPDITPPAARSIATLRASLLAGLAMLAAALILTAVIKSPARS